MIRVSKYIIHGSNIVASRQKLAELVDQSKKQGVLDVVYLNGEKVNETELRQALESSSMFGNDRLVVIEKLFSRRRSKEKDKLIDILGGSLQNSQVIVWEAKEVTKANLNKLKEFQVILFKTPVAIFKFLDSLKPQNSKVLLNLIHDQLKDQASELIFYMLCRRVSELIVAKDKKASALLKGAPWQKARLISQAKAFTLNQLLKLHSKLVRIDESIKTGKAILPLASQLDLVIFKV